MKIILSTDALPDQPLDRMVHACERRGIGGLEIILGEGQAHRLGLADGAFPERILASKIAADWLYPRGSRIDPATCVDRAEQLGAGVLLSGAGAPPAGVPAARVHSNEPEAAAEAAEWAAEHDAGTAWEVDLCRVSSEVIARVLDRSGQRLRHVRLIGGGPEAISSRETGTSELFRRLALTGYQGSIALVPSSLHRLPEWREWLLDRRGWGCNTAAEKKRKARRSS